MGDGTRPGGALPDPEATVGKKLHDPTYLQSLIAPFVAGSLLPEVRELSAHRTAAGEIEAIDGASGVLRVRVAGRLQAFACGLATEVLDHGLPAGMASLRRGDHVVLDWHRRGRRDVATRVEIVDAAAPH
jgi:hypothetical protein